jgi:hypothetical protein
MRACAHRVEPPFQVEPNAKPIDQSLSKSTLYRFTLPHRQFAPHLHPGPQRQSFHGHAEPLEPHACALPAAFDDAFTHDACAVDDDFVEDFPANKPPRNPMNARVGAVSRCFSLCFARWNRSIDDGGCRACAVVTRRRIVIQASHALARPTDDDDDDDDVARARRRVHPTREARLAPRDVDDGASNANDCARGRFRR